jgi:uncharacterized membrane protein
VSASGTKGRLNFIDAARAVAIIKMLEGHFERVVLSEQYRDHSDPIFHFFYYLSGLTAPLFFTVSGMTFVFLLAKSTENSGPYWKNRMVKKGLKRFVELMLWGHALQLSLPSAATGYIFSDYFLSMHVLQCIGISILLLIVFFWVPFRYKFIHPALLYFTLGVVVFWIYPFVKDQAFPALPQYFANYFNKMNGSLFPLFPWSGFVFFGGVLGYLISRSYKEHFRETGWAILSTGLLLHFSGFTWFVDSLNFVTHGMVNPRVDSSDWLFHYLGTIISFIGILMLLEGYIRIRTQHKPILEKFLVVGRKTFFIYIVHVIILYSNFLGVGIKSIWYKELGPWQTLLGTLLFIGFFVVLANHHDRLKARWLKLIRRIKGLRLPLFKRARRATY